MIIAAIFCGAVGLVHLFRGSDKPVDKATLGFWFCFLVSNLWIMESSK